MAISIDRSNAEALKPELYQRAIEACPNGVLVVNANGTIVLVNGEIERLFGYRSDELIGRKVEQLLPEPLRGEHAALRRSYEFKPVTRHLGMTRDFVGRRKDGGAFPIEIGLSPIRIDGKFMVVSTIVDVSERKRQEQIKDEYVATLSHELRTPMTSISAALGLLLVNAGGDLPQPATHLIEIAYSNCQRLVRLINDVLDLRKLEAGQMSFHNEDTDAVALLNKTIEANRSLANGNRIKIRLDAPPHAINVRVDPDRFIQVITNLLSNAIMFSPSGKDVVVAVEKRDDHAHITVRDEGPGIPADFKGRIFKAFAQADNDATRKTGGTGLGLSIARQIVARMDGRIGFCDAPGGGTIFYVDLFTTDAASLRQNEPASRMVR
jgi:PAS domain S-box-containing protein